MSLTPDFLELYRKYIFKILSIPSLKGHKAFILDEECTKMLGLTVSLSEVIKEDVLLVGKLLKTQASGISLNQGGNTPQERNATRHLKCAVILRPTNASITALCQQLKNPQFHSYYIFFTNNVSDDMLRPLAEADHKFELIRQVHIYYCDFYSIEPQLIVSNTTPLQYPVRVFHQSRDYWLGITKSAYERNLETVLSLILTIKAHPIIRSSNSQHAQQFASEISKRMQYNTDLYHFPQSNNDLTTLLILDRRDDPITPLLLNWSYLSMINELLPLENNRIDLRGVPDIDAELKEVTLSTIHDRFYANNMYSGFGDIASNAKKLVDDYKMQKQAATGKMDTIEDIRTAVEKVPELKQMAGTVSKHMAILIELQRQVKQQSLFALSELSQDIACENAHTAHLENIRKVLRDQYTTTSSSGQVNPILFKFESKLYLVLLYALKYEQEPANRIAEFKSTLMSTFPTKQHIIQSVDAILQHCGAKMRAKNSSVALSHNRSWFSKIGAKMSSSVKGYENVHTRYKPFITEIIEQFANKRAKPVDYPQITTFLHKTISSSLSQQGGVEVINKPQFLYLYMLGGVTYAEAAAVHAFNATSPDVKVVLSGSCVLNSKAFITSLIGEDKGRDYLDHDDSSFGAGTSDHVSLDIL